jgi:dTDP-L-rhamnose 4-epimerase
MRVVVTGGAGFVGSHVVDLLVDRRHDVTVIDSLNPSAHETRPDYLNEGARYHWVDLSESHDLRDLLDGADAVCHQASRVGLGKDFSDADLYARDNDLATARMLSALHDTGFRGRLVLASSMVVYGEGRYACPEHGVVRAPPRTAEALERGCFDPCCPVCGAGLEPLPVPEDAPVDPRSVYAATKVHQEHLCSAYGLEHDVAVAMLRYHNVYGSRMPRDTPYAGVASIFRSALVAGKAPEVLEDGRQLRDFVHVNDVARANVLAIERALPYAGPLNIASGRSRSVCELAEALCRTHKSTPLEPCITGRFRAGDVRHIFASATLARDQLGFVALADFSTAVAEFALAPLRSRRAGT